MNPVDPRSAWQILMEQFIMAVAPNLVMLAIVMAIMIPAIIALIVQENRMKRNKQ